MKKHKNSRSTGIHSGNMGKIPTNANSANHQPSVEKAHARQDMHCSAPMYRPHKGDNGTPPHLQK